MVRVLLQKFWSDGILSVVFHNGTCDARAIVFKGNLGKIWLLNTKDKKSELD